VFLQVSLPGLITRRNVSWMKKYEYIRIVEVHTRHAFRNSKEKGKKKREKRKKETTMYEITTQQGDWGVMAC
jgi:hypothetical protein